MYHNLDATINTLMCLLYRKLIYSSTHLIYFWAVVLKVIWRSLGGPWGPSGGPWYQNYFQNNTKRLFPFFTLILSRVYGEVLQACDTATDECRDEHPAVFQPNVSWTLKRSACFFRERLFSTKLLFRLTRNGFIIFFNALTNIFTFSQFSFLMW